MSEPKMGTHYVREIAESFRTAATTCNHAGIKSKLVTLADEMEPLAGKLYFKTQKGTEDMEVLGGKVDGLGPKLAGWDQAAAETFLNPIFKEIEQTLDHVKNMKVRMT
jgi:hypothetical protein